MNAYKKLSRREMIGAGCIALMGAAFSASKKMREPVDGERTYRSGLPFRISLNTATISGYRLSVEEQIDLVGEAGFDGIELWVRDVESYLMKAGTCESLSQRLKSRKLILENMIGFAPWCSDDDQIRKEGIEQLHREMEMTAQLDGKYIAAPIVGLKTLDEKRFREYTERYRTILDLGDKTGVVPILELWGAGALNQLSDCARIVVATGHPRATMLLDFYHLYRGGNSWNTLDCLNGGRLPVFHVNDYPGEPGREELRDSDRVFPGDGICPFKEVIPMLYRAGFRGSFSVELFNKKYWETMNVKTVLKKSYDKTLLLLKEAMLFSTSSSNNGHTCQFFSIV